MDFVVLGIQHITDIDGADHMIFLCALAAGLNWKSWKELALLATAFTLGHSITLGLAALNIVSFNRELIEALIAVTIVLTSVLRLIENDKSKKSLGKLQYALIIGFGLIHGLGFSTFLRMMLSDPDHLLLQLFQFNIGVEIGQILILSLFVLLNSLLLRYITTLSSAQLRRWTAFLTALAGFWLLFSM